MEYPDWGKPLYHNFKRKEFRTGHDQLAFHGGTTYKGAFTTKSPPDLGPLNTGNSK